MATILCKQCNYENEGERIYCHNCGAKLDRSLIPQDTKTAEPIEKQRKRVGKLMNPKRGFFVGGWTSLLSTIAWSVLAAGVIQAARAPDDIPPALKTGDLEESGQLLLALEEKAALRMPQSIGISEEAANKYLSHSIRSRSQGVLADAMKFDRAFIQFEEGACRISTQQSVFGYPLYMGVLDQLAIQSNHVAATTIGGNIGRLPIHPLIMGYSDVVFKKLWDALVHEQKLVDGMQSIVLHHGKIELVTKGATPAGSSRR
ncbi:MAG: hypothetical protein QOD99_1948 [Chthoniobacter sp.]|jgi:hypothetical protein|nr:hypothetical protein [Chthoniobacter sp.]